MGRIMGPSGVFGITLSYHGVGGDEVDGVYRRTGKSGSCAIWWSEVSGGCNSFAKVKKDGGLSCRPPVNH